MGRDEGLWYLPRTARVPRQEYVPPFVLRFVGLLRLEFLSFQYRGDRRLGRGGRHKILLLSRRQISRLSSKFF